MYCAVYFTRALSHRVGLALLKTAEDTLLALPFERLLTALNSKQFPAFSRPPAQLLKLALSFRVSFQRMRSDPHAVCITCSNHKMQILSVEVPPSIPVSSRMFWPVASRYPAWLTGSYEAKVTICNSQ